MELVKLSAKTIAQVEEQLNLSIYEAMLKPVIKNMATIISVRDDITYDEALNYIDKRLATDATLDIIWYELQQQLIKEHFLSPLPNQEIIDKIAMEMKKKISDSVNSGNQKKN